MKYLKLFENFEQPEGTGKDTAWEVEVDGETVKVTLADVMNYLDDLVEIEPEELKHLLIDVERDPKRVGAADLSYPIILVSSGEEYTSIIDGQHRVVKALRDGVPVKARILDLDNAPEKFKAVFG
jgi:hypothetical protein